MCKDFEIPPSDAKKLVPTEKTLIQYEYSRANSNLIQNIYVLQTYKHKDGSKGGYSFHHFILQPPKKDGTLEYKQAANKYISGDKWPLAFKVNLDGSNQLRIRVAEN